MPASAEPVVEDRDPLGGGSSRYLSPILVCALLVIGSGILAFVLYGAVQRQEEQLLDRRITDAEAVANSLVTEDVAGLDSIAEALDDNTDQTTSFQRTTGPLLSSNREYRGFLLLQVAGDGTVSILQNRGDVPPVGAPVPVDMATAAARAADNGQLITAGPIITTERGERRRTFAISPSTLPDGQVLYGEKALESAGTQKLGEFAQFSELEIAFFVGGEQNANSLLVSNTRQVPLLGDDVSLRPVRYGDDDFLLAVRTREPLTGSLSEALPRVALGAGIVFAVLVAAIVHVLQQRRRYALALADQRTEELSHSLEALRKRTELDTMLRDLSHSVASAPDIPSAVQALYDIVSRHLPLDRVAITMVTGPEELEVVAAAGPAGAYAAVGRKVRVPAYVLTGEQLSDVTTWPDYDLGMASAVAIPLVAGGRPRALLSLASAKPNAYDEEQAVFLRTLGRETTPVFTQLLSLERERQAAAQALALDQLKTEFVGIVAHDLRSPMTIIAGFADLLRARGDRLTDEQRDDYLKRISTSTKNLSHLVEDVLQVARIESGELTYEDRSFDLGTMVERSSAEAALAFPDREVVLDIPDDLPQVFADEQRQWQVFNNLINNALKYSKDAPVEVRLREDGNFVAVQVVDHGIGVAPDDVGKLFQKFSRVKQHAPNKEPGTGLGLYISKTIVEAEGGAIAVTSTLGEGSTFTYTVKIA